MSFEANSPLKWKAFGSLLKENDKINEETYTPIKYPTDDLIGLFHSEGLDKQLVRSRLNDLQEILVRHGNRAINSQHMDISNALQNLKFVHPRVDEMAVWHECGSEIAWCTLEPSREKPANKNLALTMSG